MSTKKVLKTTGKIVLNVLVWLFIILCVLGVFVTIMGKKTSDGTTNVFGMQMRIVTSSSMEECEYVDVSDYDIEDIPIKSMVFIELVPDDPIERDAWYNSLEKGDVLTFSYVFFNEPAIITHRIVEIEHRGVGDHVITLQGDNRTSEEGVGTQTIYTIKDSPLDYVIGKVVWQSYPLGLFVQAIREPVGLVCMIIVPASFIAIWEVIKIIGMCTAGKRQRAREKSEEQQNELDELKRRLAELEAAQGPAGAVTQEAPPEQTEQPK